MQGEGRRLPHSHSPVCEAAEPFTVFRMTAPTLGMAAINTHTDSILILDQPSSTSVMQCGILTAVTMSLIAFLALEKAVLRSDVRMI